MGFVDSMCNSPLSSPLSLRSSPESVAATLGPTWSPRPGMSIRIPPRSPPGSTAVSPSWSPPQGSPILGETTPPQSPQSSGDLLEEELAKYTASVSSCSVNPRYYFDDEISFFKVENQRFRVHRHFLARDSVYFQELFAGPLGDFGDRESEAIPLEGIGSAEFECLLDFFYDGMYRSPKDSLSQWITLLSVATRFRFDRLRAQAIRAIDESATPLDPVDKVVLATKFDVPAWLAPAFVALCQRPKCLEEWEAEKIGLKRTVQLARAREEYRDAESLRGRPPSPIQMYKSWQPSPCPASPRDDYQAAQCAAHIVDEVFFP